jgi:Raf kinase inhibitor-like YbhB/YbcL family protein
MRLHSPAFADGAPIPLLYTAEGDDISPPLQWSDVPPQACSLCLILDDPDAPAGLWIHWVVYDIPPQAGGLPAGLPRAPRLADDSCQGRCWGVHHFPRLGYHGPLPPPGPAHHYRFTLSALAQRLGWRPGATAPELRQAMAPLLLAEAVLHGTYAATASAARH